MPFRVRRLVLVAVAVACASVPATAVAASAPATASVIVYRCGADFANLCRLDPVSRHDQPLTSDGNQSMAYQSPSLSRDGRHLAFVFNQQVYVGDANAGERQPVPGTQGARNADLRPDAKAVSFLRFRVTHHRLCPPPSGGPCSSEPDESEIALWTSLLDGSGMLRRQLASPGTTASWLGNSLVAPRQIASRRFTRQLVCVLAGQRCARLVAADRSQDIDQPTVSPDGRLLVATVGRALDLVRPAGRLAVYSTRTGRRLRFLTDGPRDAQPTWSPDGRFVAFTRYARDVDTSPATVDAVPVRGGAPRRLAAGKDPTWALARG